MTTTGTTAELVPGDDEASLVPGFLRPWLSAARERRRRARLRATLHDLPDRALRDIGICRAEIEYFVLNGSDEGIDPRRRT
jgi:uncharacterized protein YjiS (DUF1127 family)